MLIILSGAQDLVFRGLDLRGVYLVAMEAEDVIELYSYLESH